MLYLVTGGGGFLGRHIVARLRERGDSVRVFGRGAYPDFDAAGVEVRQGRLQDPNALDVACAGVDGVFHVASKTGIVGRYAEYFQANVLGTRELIAACLRQSVKCLVYTSTPSVVFGASAIVNGDESLPYPSNFLTHYAETKAQAERCVLAANGAYLRTCALRPHLIWGPGDTNLLPRMVARAKAGKLMQVGKGQNLISVSYVENTAQAHLAAMDALAAEIAHAPNRDHATVIASSEASPVFCSTGTTGAPGVGEECVDNVCGRVFFVNELAPVNCWGFINRLLAVCGVGPIQKRLSFRVAYAAGFSCEQLGRFRPGWEPPMTRFLALQLAKDHSFSPLAAFRALRWQPQFSIEDGLERLRTSLSR